jgi:hypothetical protein
VSEHGQKKKIVSGNKHTQQIEYMRILSTGKIPNERKEAQDYRSAERPSSCSSPQARLEMGAPRRVPLHSAAQHQHLQPNTELKLNSFAVFADRSFSMDNARLAQSP